MIGDIQHVGRAWVLPHPERETPQVAPLVRDDETERAAIAAVTAHEEARGWQVESVEAQNRGFDLISRRPHPEDPKTAIEVRFIEVKGRAAVAQDDETAGRHARRQRLVALDGAACDELEAVEQRREHLFTHGWHGCPARGLPGLAIGDLLRCCNAANPCCICIKNRGTTWRF
jgi:Domain of unknown function (DUF3883)